MRKLNNRIIFFSCVAMMFGVVLSSFETAWKILCVAGLFGIFFVGVLTLLQSSDGPPKSFVACGMLAFFVLGICAGYAQQIIYDYRYQECYGVVKCEITEASETQFVVTNIYVDSEYTPGKALVYCDTAYLYEAGDKVIFIDTLVPIPIFENGELNYQFSSGIQYRTTATEIFESSHKYNLKNTIKNAVYDIQETMFGENVGISYAMTFGDTSLVDYSSLSILRRGGVAHIFAVSGLHIGILYLLLKMFSWIKPRSSLKQKAIFNLIVLAVLFGYVYLCDFTASSSRAFLMIFASVLLTRFGQTRDRLTVISAVAFILMLYSPYIIFTAGFQLSFMAVFGLAIFPSKIEKHLAFLRSEKLISAVAIAISACVSTMIVSCYHFGYISTISVFLNIIIVPIYSLIYVANLVGMAICATANLLGFEAVTNAICPYFTNEIYNFTILAFEYIENIVPLAFYVTLPICVVIAYHGVAVCYSALVSDSVNGKRKLAFCVSFCLVVCIPFAVSQISIDRQGITFYQTSTQPLTIETKSETFIFVQSGGELDFSNVKTETVHVCVYDNYYKDLSVTGGEGLDINIYASFLSETPSGACSLYDFQEVSEDIYFSSYQTLTYNGVTFQLGNSVVVTDGSTTSTHTKNDFEYYVIDGVLTTDESYSISR